MHKVLVPTDGSEASLGAVRFVVTLAKERPDLEIHLLNVRPALPSTVTTFVDPNVVKDYHDEEGQKELAPARRILDEAGLRYQADVRVGRATAECIAAYADEHGCDQIVMGTRGLSAVPSLLMGSVASRVLHLTSVPVTFVK